MRWWLCLLLCACGRIAFDPVGGASPSGEAGVPAGDGPRSGDASGAPGDGAPLDGAPDALPAACAHALPIQAGMPIRIDSCSGGDLLDGCGPAGTQEVVFAFTPATSGSYTVGAYDAGTNNISSSTGVLDPTCTQVQGCAGLLSRPFTAGVTVYFAVEASTGGCKSIDFKVM